MAVICLKLSNYGILLSPLDSPGNRTLLPVFVYPDEEDALAFTSASALKFEQGGSGSDGAVAGLLNQIKKYEQERSVQAATLNVTNNTLGTLFC